MKLLKRSALVLIGVFLVIQFFRPTRNVAEGNIANDIAQFNVPQDIRSILNASCYDCHSNNTRYPWYAEVQPVGWWLSSHIQEGRRNLNFSEFAGYRPRRQYIKLKQIAEQIDEGDMPLPSYLIIHTDARLSKEQKTRLIDWVNTLRDSMKAVYPVDSLERRRSDRRDGER